MVATTTAHPARSNVTFLLSISFFSSAILNSLVGLVSPPGSSLDLIELIVVLSMASGIACIFYWVRNRPDYSLANRPLGITLLIIQSILGGAVLVLVGISLLLLPIIGIIGVMVGGIGVGYLYEAKGLWDEKFWALQVMFILTVIALIANSVFLAIGRIGSPFLALFQLWYLRRAQVRNYFTS